MKLILVIILAIAGAACGTVPEPRLESVTGSAVEMRLLERSRGLIGAGEYVQALQLARQALALNPDSVEALLAVAACHFAMNDYAGSIASSRRAARYRSDLLPDIYLLLGSAYERLDAVWDALRTWRVASRRFPENALLRYRLALIYIELEKPELAGDSLKAVLRLDPLNPHPHYQLGMLYADHGYRVPAVLALGLALVLEPRAGPVTAIHETIDRLLQADGEPPPGNDEGDFAAVWRAVSEASRAATGQHSAADAIAVPVKRYRALLEAVAESPGAVNGSFVTGFYLPFYRGLYEHDLIDVFVNLVFAARDDPAHQSWLQQHPAMTARLEAFVRGHDWQAAPAPDG